MSLGLTFASAQQSMTWAPETVGGIMVLLQVALIVPILAGLLGLGLYRFTYGDVLGGYSAGGGLRWRAGSSYALSLDGRWHDNWTNPSSDRELGFITAGLGVTLLH